MSYASACCVDAMFVFNEGVENGVLISDATIHEQSVIDKDTRLWAFYIRDSSIVIATNDNITILSISICLIICGVEAYQAFTITIVYVFGQYQIDGKLTSLNFRLTVEQQAIAQFEVILRPSFVTFGLIFVLDRKSVV